MDLDSAELEKRGLACIDRDFVNKKPSWALGSISHYDSIFLSGLIQHLKPRRSVEIGVASGWSSAIMLRSLTRSQVSDFSLYGIDLDENFYLDRSIGTGQAIEEVALELSHCYSLITGTTALEAMPAVGAVDFAFIDAHHMHPWATLDMISVLPFLDGGAWVAMHDLNLCRIERHKHANRGPFYLFNLWQGEKIQSTQDPAMIGAVYVDNKKDAAIGDLLEIIYTPWEIRLSKEMCDKLIGFIERYFGETWSMKYHDAIRVLNH